MACSSKCPSDIPSFVPYVNWLWYQVDAKLRLIVVFVMQRSMRNQIMAQILTHNSQSLDTKGFRTLRQPRRCFLIFWCLNKWTLFHSFATLPTETQDKDDDPLPCMTPWEYRFAWKPMNSPAKEWLFPETSLQTNLKKQSNTCLNNELWFYYQCQKRPQLHEHPTYL